jgi:Cof subfamily protein (haloacid dehalogenase superfamily)
VKYKAIIFDLDGTAIPSDPVGLPSQKLVDTVVAFKEKILLCAATGRPLSNSKYIFDALRLKEPCIISGGSQIYDPLQQKIVWERLIEHADVEGVLRIAHPYHYEVLLNETLLGSGKPAREHMTTPDDKVNVMYIMGCSTADADAMLQQLRQLPNIVAADVVSWINAGVDIHITHKAATKEYAARELLTLLGLESEEVIAVGDGNNDIPLFKTAGRKIAMGNSTTELKEIADEICGSLADDGLADVIALYANTTV